jgi:hypothetical protein
MPGRPVAVRHVAVRTLTPMLLQAGMQALMARERPTSANVLEIAADVRFAQWTRS